MEELELEKNKKQIEVLPVQIVKSITQTPLQMTGYGVQTVKFGDTNYAQTTKDKAGSYDHILKYTVFQPSTFINFSLNMPTRPTVPYRSVDILVLEELYNGYFFKRFFCDGLPKLQV